MIIQYTPQRQIRQEQSELIHIFLLFILTGIVRSDANMSGNPDKVNFRFIEWTNSSRN